MVESIRGFNRIGHALEILSSSWMDLKTPRPFFSHAVIEKSQNNSDDRCHRAKLKWRVRTWGALDPPPLSHHKNMVKCNI